MELRFSGHAVKRMGQDRLTVADVRFTIAEGEVIKTYPDDRPFPSQLSLAWRDDRPVHVVWATEQASGIIIVITAYQPDPQKWDAAFKIRRTS